MSPDISIIVNEIRESHIKTLDELEKKYPEELKAYPVLLKNVFNSNFEWKIYDNMMHTKSCIDNSDLSFEKGSELVGQELVDKFVKPLLPS
tara:strand:+ start:209 stop:481 length:273 start_codon:yes stop_codon:yes gene_type:complete